MTAETVKIIITAEVAERKVELGTIALEVDDRLDERNLKTRFDIVKAK